MGSPGNRDERKDGLEADAPLDKDIGCITVAVRPPDQLLMDSLREGLSDTGLPESFSDGPISLGIRSMDGFYFFPDISVFMEKEDQRPISVVQYDPVRRTFLLSNRTGSGTEIMELFWYAFEVFAEDSVVVFYPKESEVRLEPPERTDERVEFFLSIMRNWKQSPILEENEMGLWRGRDMASLFSFLKDVQ